MTLVLNLDVHWPSGRLVHAHCLGMSLVSERQDYKARTEVTPLDSENVASLVAFHELLAEATRVAPDGGTVEVVGLEPEVRKILKLLKIEAEPPDPIMVALEQP